MIHEAHIKNESLFIYLGMKFKRIETDVTLQIRSSERQRKKTISMIISWDACESTRYFCGCLQMEKEMPEKITRNDSLSELL